MGVDHDPAIRVHRDLGEVEIELVPVRPAAGRAQEGVPGHHAPVGEGHAHLLSVPAHLGHLASEVDVPPLAGERGECRGDSSSCWRSSAEPWLIQETREPNAEKTWANSAPLMPPPRMIGRAGAPRRHQCRRYPGRSSTPGRRPACVERRAGVLLAGARGCGTKACFGRPLRSASSGRTGGCRRLPELPEERPEIANEQLRLLQGGEVAAGGHLGPVSDGV